MSEIVVTTPPSFTITTLKHHGFKVGDSTYITVAGKRVRALVMEVENPFKVRVTHDPRNRKQRRAAQAQSSKT